MAHIDYYASLNSPWAYLGSGRIEAIAARHGASLRIWPVDFSIIFPASGGLPLPRRSPQRQAYRMQELARWRDHLGVPLTLRPAASPFAEPLAAQAVIALREGGDDAAAVRLAHRIMRAVWAEERDPGLPSTLATLITECGLEAGPLLALAAEPRWAERRRADSEAALARGVFGAPTYVIDAQLFWGQDRLDFVERALV
ncbi:MAG: 2-hydroxychromene-2-carboxylate isomerase [Pseudomonadota bacterium]